MKPTKKTHSAKSSSLARPTIRPVLRSPALRFTPWAWAKLLYLRDAGETEIGAFGISAADDLLTIEDLGLVAQECTSVTVEFDDASVADFFDAQVDAGRRPERFGRLWIHTHPGSSPQPSATDEATFRRVFGPSDWAVMFILARGGQTYCRLRFNTGPGGELTLPVDVDYSRPFGGSNQDAWQAEYDKCVREPLPAPQWTGQGSRITSSEEEPFNDDWLDAWCEYLHYDGLENPYGNIRDF